MGKRILKITATAIALVLLCGILWFANGFFGNPVSYLLAKNVLNRYVEETYSHLDLKTERFGFNIKTGGYFAHMASETSMDTAFYINMDMLGHVTYDSYETWVTEKRNTEQRVQEQYREFVKTVLESEEFCYQSEIMGGELNFETDREVGDPRDYSYALSRDELIHDKEYTLDEIRNMAARAGILTMYVWEDNVSVQRAAEIMLDIKAIFDEAGVPFYRMDFVLQYPRPEDESPWPEGDVRAELTYEDIHEDGLIQRIQESHDAIYAYFAELDKEKAMEIGSND